MHVFTLILWIVSLVLLALAALSPRPFTYLNAGWAGLFFFDLWIGLQFLIEVSDPITF
jgi:hypothetical protein